MSTETKNVTAEKKSTKSMKSKPKPKEPSVSETEPADEVELIEVSLATKPMEVHLTKKDKEEEKKADTTRYILNPKTGNMILRTSTNGKLLVKGLEIPDPVSDLDRCMTLINQFKDKLELEDEQIKDVLEPILKELPRGFPKEWGGKQKKVKDPNAPKKPLTDWIIYSTEMRPIVRDANPDMEEQQILSEVGVMWKELKEKDAKQHAKYTARAKKDQLRYEAEMETYHKDHPSPESTPVEPKKVNAFTIFRTENKERIAKENPEMDPREVQSQVAAEWKEIKENDKEVHAKYQAKADEANKDFENELKAFVESGGKKKLSATEAKKANDPDYELNPKTLKYILKKKTKTSKPTKKSVAEVEAEADSDSDAGLLVSDSE